MSSDGAANGDDTVTVTTGEAPTDAAADDEEEGLGRVGWVLVAAVVVAVLVVPGMVYLWPAGGAVFGATYRSAMLVLPMIPAVILGLIAVWSMRDRR
ncbi:hypothetical protein [Haloplanus natans]|uniref:hypothetical protein n=1 Tax=Haloplanus natans TaxID=376171 RepID=UPI000677AEC4|nr:hypothetical protein [Haloplanus natans]